MHHIGRSRRPHTGRRVCGPPCTAQRFCVHSHVVLCAMSKETHQIAVEFNCKLNNQQEK